MTVPAVPGVPTERCARSLSCRLARYGLFALSVKEVQIVDIHNQVKLLSRAHLRSRIHSRRERGATAGQIKKQLISEPLGDRDTGTDRRAGYPGRCKVSSMNVLRPD